MKSTGTCPKCSCTALWYIESVASNEDVGWLQVQPTFQIAVTGKGPRARHGGLEAYACQQCGYVELYLKERLVVDGQHVREPHRPETPYRG